MVVWGRVKEWEEKGERSQDSSRLINKRRTKPIFHENTDSQEERSQLDSLNIYFRNMNINLQPFQRFSGQWGQPHLALELSRYLEKKIMSY